MDPALPVGLRKLARSDRNRASLMPGVAVFGFAL